MENKKFTSVASAVLLLGLLVVGGHDLTEDKAYFCESRSIAMNCERTTATRCYFDDSYKICKEGWQPFKDILETNITNNAGAIFVNANGGSFQCRTENGKINSYTKCTKDDGKEAYLGELI